MLLAFLLASLACSLVLFPGPAARAQGGPTVTDGGVDDNFPTTIVFHVSAHGDSPITKIRLHYTILPDGTAAIAEPKFQSGTSVTTTFELQGNNPPNIYLPPGTTIQYYWEVTDAAGNTGKTDRASFFYNDVRFNWTSVTQSGITLYYYSGSDSDARAMLSVAADRISSMSKLLGATITFPIRVWAYNSTDDMRPALERRSATFEQSIITAGVRVSSDTVLVLGNASFDTLRHELTHVVTHVAGESPFGSLPTWLDEGTAVYGQSDPGSYKSAVDSAFESGNVLSVRSITSYPGDPDQVELFYGESWSLVSFLNDKYGPDKFAQLYAAIKKGKTIDDALQTVYGFNQDGLEDAWRAAHNLPARQTPAPTPQATVTPSPSQGATATSDSGGTSVGTIILLTAGILLLAGLVGASGVIIARKYR